MISLEWKHCANWWRNGKANLQKITNNSEREGQSMEGLVASSVIDKLLLLQFDMHWLSVLNRDYR